MVEKRARQGEGSRQPPPAQQPPQVHEENDQEDDEGPSRSYFRFYGSAFSLFKVINYSIQDVKYYATCKKEFEKA
ncbi:unnamed protein product [Linum trigynum]|uniref:Uncharacterized protein n=1 Tax=Linum trigynum TaxID=586398 RepID=A0AAV2CCY6_9ROSI